MYKHYIRHKFLMSCGEPCYLFYDNYEEEHNISEFKEFPGIRFKYDFIESEIEELKNEKIIDFDFISLGEQLDAIKKFEGSVKIDKVEETSLYDIYQNLKLKNLI